MTTLDERIAAAERRLQQLRARKRRAEARAAALERKRDTRRKILVGAAVLAKVARGEWPEDRLRALLDAELNRADDRALFGLPPRDGGDG